MFVLHAHAQNTSTIITLCLSTLPRTDSHTRRCPLERDEATPTRVRTTELPEALRCNQLLRMACAPLRASKTLDMRSLLEPALTPRSSGRSRYAPRL